MNRYPAFSILLAFFSLVGIARGALAQESLIPLVKRIQPAVVTVIASGVSREGAATTEGLYTIGLRFVGGEDYAKALPYFEEAVQRNPRYAEAWFQVGFCNDALGRWHEAVAALQQAIRLKPDDAEAYYNLGGAYGQLGHYQKAVVALQQAIRLKPDYAEAHNNLGGAFGELGRWHEAVAAFQQATRLKPDYAKAHCNLGGAYGQLRRWHEAVTALQQAIRLKPDFAEAHCNLGLVYLILGDRDSALEEYKILKTSDRNLAEKLFSAISQ